MVNNYTNYQKQPTPANYSGVTIQIMNPSVHANPNGSVTYSGGCTSNHNCSSCVQPIYPQSLPSEQINNLAQTTPVEQARYPQAYPAPYYTTNYNNAYPVANPNYPNSNISGNSNFEHVEQEPDMSKSNEIINKVDKSIENEKEQKAKGKKKKVIPLTNEYIMSLENYLNNENKEVRLMAAKDILARLDEDHERYDDAALNALLNKMLQDPDKHLRILALSALSSQLASGNDFTVQLLNNMENNPNTDKEDLMQIAQIKLCMTTRPETIYEPVDSKVDEKEDKYEPKSYLQ